MVQWNDTVEEITIPNYYGTAELWPDDLSNASQSMNDELLNGDDTLGQDFESLDDLALDEMALDEMGLEVDSDKAFLDNMEGMPSPDGNMAAGAGLLSGAVFVKAQAFLVRKISSLRNMSDDGGLDEVVDVDDIKNAAA
jgi:hypothetical protein